MKIIFISGVSFGYSILEHILKNGWKIDTIFSYDDSKKKFYSDMINFENLSSKYNIPNIKVQNINDQDNIEIIKKIKPDIILVMGWSQIIKTDIIEIPKIGIIGSHPTELPKFRGRAPIPWSILKNLSESALTFFWIEKGVDNGNILDQEKFPIHKYDDATSLYEKIIVSGKKMILKNLKDISEGVIFKSKQDESKFIENWPKRSFNDGKIDWRKSADEIDRLIRASTYPYPGAFTIYRQKKLFIWKSTIIDKPTKKYGEILEINNNNLQVATGNGILKLDKVSLNKKTTINQIFSKSDVGVVLE
jgi:methionyl-tRNA formyltransferase